MRQNFDFLKRAIFLFQLPSKLRIVFGRAARMIRRFEWRVNDVEMSIVAYILQLFGQQLGERRSIGLVFVIAGPFMLG